MVASGGPTLASASTGSIHNELWVRWGCGTATMLGCSKWLAAEGLSFGEIVNQLRSDLATHYLSDPNLPISEMAWLLGYKAVSAFSHAYKQSTEMNPRKMRDKLLASH